MCPRVLYQRYGLPRTHKWTHYNHKNICRGVTGWGITGTDGTFYPDLVNTRDFATVEEMNDAIVNSINKYVMEGDILYHLGDWSFGGINSIWEFRKRINCKNIHLILGNHDENIKKNKILPNGTFKELYEYFQPWDTSDNLTLQPAQDLFTSVQNYLEIEIDKIFFALSHHPFEEWWEMNRKGSIHLQGHCHHKLDHTDENLYYRRKDVGIDWEEFRPYSLDEILEEMKERKIKKHNS